MSCENCDKRQEENLRGENLIYMRVGNGNVLIGACDKHFIELRDKMREKEKEGKK